MPNKAYRDAHKAMGLCIICPSLAEPERQMCKYHLEKRNEFDHNKRFDREQRKVCRECGGPRTPRSTFCSDCLEKHRKNTKKSREVLLAAGCCITCGDGLDSKNVRCAKCRDHAAVLAAKIRRKLLKTIMDHYGAICACCGEKNPLFLTLDHKNNDGAEQRRIMPGKETVFRWIIKEGFPESYQILCYNCNCGRHRNGNVCPHISNV
jgi:hypothetical protein